MNEIIFEKISCGLNHNLLLSREGDIYVFGDNSYAQLGTGDTEEIFYPQKLKHSEKFTDISSHSLENISIFVSDKNDFHIWGNQVINEPKKTKFKSFDEIFEYYYKINYKPIQNRIISFNYHFVKNGKYQKEFNTEEPPLGEGYYGKVYKVKKKHTNEDKFFAIKKIIFTSCDEDEFLNELLTSPIISGLRNKNLLKYYDLWLEKHSESRKYIFYILMELCDKTLDDFIQKEMKKDSKLYSYGMLTELGFYIASEIFTQILNGVNYLHKQNKPIMHRDLKPDNIMLKIKDDSKYFVKIADFGLATVHKYADQVHSANRGNENYRAPEVSLGLDLPIFYNTKADIYSLAIVLKELFFIKYHRYLRVNHCFHVFSLF
jgi:hypothetical protein